MLSYTVVLSLNLRDAYSRLPHDDRASIGRQVAILAKAAEAVRAAGDVERKWSDLAGLSAGDHRVLFGDLWLSYCLDTTQHTLRLMDFGDARLTSRTAPRLLPSAWREESTGEDVWANEGGSGQDAEPFPELHVVK